MQGRNISVVVDSVIVHVEEEPCPLCAGMRSLGINCGSIHHDGAAHNLVLGGVGGFSQVCRRCRHRHRGFVALRLHLNSLFAVADVSVCIDSLYVESHPWLFCVCAACDCGNGRISYASSVHSASVRNATRTSQVPLQEFRVCESVIRGKVIIEVHLPCACGIPYAAPPVVCVERRLFCFAFCDCSCYGCDLFIRVTVIVRNHEVDFAVGAVCHGSRRSCGCAHHRVRALSRDHGLHVVHSQLAGD